MLKKTAAALCCVWALTLAVNAAPNESGTSARAAVVTDTLTGRVLFDYNGDERLAQASTTKIMTALLALEEPEIDTYFTVDAAAIRVEGSSMGLQEGDQVSLRQLCYGMILPSGNDAANATAVRLAGSVPAFAEMMNERAFQLGLEDTRYVTPSGLDAPGHYSSARDLASLARYAMGDPIFREICSQESAKTKFGNPPFERWLKNYNKLLGFYEPCIGVKTGFTDDAGRVLVSAAARDGVELVCVTMNDADDWADHQRLYEQFFNELTPTDIGGLIGSVEVPVAGGTAPCAAARTVGETRIPLRAGEEERLEVLFNLPPFEYAPVKAGDFAGTASLVLDGETVYTLPLAYQNGVEALRPAAEKGGLAARLGAWLRGLGSVLNRPHAK